MQEVIEFGTDPHKIIHTNAPDTSRDAGHSVDTKTDEEVVFNLIKSAGSNGLTIKEAAFALGKFPNQISGRFTALQNKTLIEDSGERRGKSRVMVIANDSQLPNGGVRVGAGGGNNPPFSSRV